MKREVIAFLFAGGSAAAINWLARIGLSLVLPLALAVLLAYAIGMAVGFVLYRHWVFRANSSAAGGQLVRFIGVNMASGALVVLLTLGLVAGLAPLAPAAGASFVEMLAHGLAIGAGAVFNFAAHRFITFAAATRRA